MVTPHGVQVTFAKTVHIIFPSAVRYVDLGSDRIIAGKADGAENVIRVKATTEGFPGENELFRHLRGWELLFVQCPVCA